MPDRICAHCGSISRGYLPTCARCREYLRRSGRLPPLTCSICDTPLPRPLGRLRVCSTRCRNARNRQTADPAKRRASDRRYKAANPEKFKGWTDSRRDAYQRRRAKKAGAPLGAKVSWRDLWAAGGDCGICGELVDATVRWPDPMSGSLDHIVPLARGGAHDPSNVQLAHLRCNIAKRDHTAA